MLLPLFAENRSHRKGPVGRPPYCRLPPGRKTWWSRPTAGTWGTQRGVVITIPFHTPARVHATGRRALSLVRAPRGHSLLAFGTFLPSVGWKSTVQVGEVAGVSQKLRGRPMSTPSPLAAPQGSCRRHPGRKQRAAEGLKGTPEGQDSPVGQTPLPCSVGPSARPEAPGHRILTEGLPAVSRPPVFNLFLNFPRAWPVAWV